MLQTDFIPARQAGSKWLLIALHGLGDSMEGYRWLPRALDLPALNCLLVNAPDAYYGGFSWYDFAADPGPGVRRSHKLLESLLDSQREKGFPTENTFLFGFSQGCLVTIETGLRYHGQFAGLIGVSGYVWEPETLVKNLSPMAKLQYLLLTHGLQDALIPAAQVRPQIEILKKAGIQLDWHEFMKDHTIIEAELLLFRRFLDERMSGSPKPAGMV